MHREITTKVVGYMEKEILIIDDSQVVVMLNDEVIKKADVPFNKVKYPCWKVINGRVYVANVTEGCVNILVDGTAINIPNISAGRYNMEIHPVTKGKQQVYMISFKLEVV
jgi:hypothetical protein